MGEEVIEPFLETAENRFRVRGQEMRKENGGQITVFSVDGNAERLGTDPPASEALTSWLGKRM